MGATSFTHLGTGPDVGKAFDAARSEAIHEHGHGGYSGSLAEKPGYFCIQQTPVSETEAHALVRRLLDADDHRINDKWGSAGAIPVVRDFRTVVVKDLTGVDDDWSYKARDNGYAEATKVLKEREVLKRGESIRALRMLSREVPTSRGYGYGSAPKPVRFTKGQCEVEINKATAPRTVEVKFTFPGPVGYDNRGEWEKVVTGLVNSKLKTGERIASIETNGKAQVKVKAVAKANDGKAVTRYIIAGSNRHDRWETGLESQAAARAKALELAKSGAVSWDATQPFEMKITAVTKRENGDALVTVSRQIVSTTAVAKVVIAQVTNEKPDGWLFFGMAPC